MSIKKLILRVKDVKGIESVYEYEIDLSEDWSLSKFGGDGRELHIDIKDLEIKNV